MSPNQVVSVLVYLVASASALVAPQVTAAAQLAPRQVNSICGYYEDGFTTQPITCGSGSACAIATDPVPAIGYCDGSPVVTSAYDFGSWPISGCGSGEICCPSASPAWVEFDFSAGATVALGCGQAHTTYDAFFGDVLYTPAAGSSATPTFGGASFTPADNGLSSSPTAPVTDDGDDSSDSGDDSSSSDGSKSKSSKVTSKELSTGAKAGIGVGCGILAIIIGVFVRIKRRWLKSKLSGHGHRTAPSQQPPPNNFPPAQDFAQQQYSQPSMSPASTHAPPMQTYYPGSPNMAKAPEPVMTEVPSPMTSPPMTPRPGYPPQMYQPYEGH